MGELQKAQKAQQFLLDQLEYDATGQVKDAKLDFDQRVMYSIAMSLVRICNRLEEIKEER